MLDDQGRRLGGVNSLAIFNREIVSLVGACMSESPRLLAFVVARVFVTAAVIITEMLMSPSMRMLMAVVFVMVLFAYIVIRGGSSHYRG